ncbi:hypothetical protein AMTRI_Chr01g109140 [Amborella trichopoda]
MVQYLVIMKVISWNARGLGATKRKREVLLLVRNHKPNLLLLQETKLPSLSLHDIRDICGIGQVDFVGVDVIRASGAIWTIWDSSVMKCLDFQLYDRFCFNVFEGPVVGLKWLCVNMYGSNVNELKEEFLQSLSNVILNVNFPWCIVGNFNMIRRADDISSNAYLNRTMRYSMILLSNFLLVGFVGLAPDFKWGLLNAYGPQTFDLKEVFVNDMSDALNSVVFRFVLGGDFNFIRWPDECNRGGSITATIRLFNRFIGTFALTDLPILGTVYTWTNGNSVNIFMSRLNRFLVSSDWSQCFPLALVKALPRLSFDHTPILLCSKVISKGLKPFRLEISWLQEKEAIEIVKSTWENTISFGSLDFQLHKTL